MLNDLEQAQQLESVARLEAHIRDTYAKFKNELDRASLAKNEMYAEKRAAKLVDLTQRMQYELNVCSLELEHRAKAEEQASTEAQMESFMKTKAQTLDRNQVELDGKKRKHDEKLRLTQTNMLRDTKLKLVCEQEEYQTSLNVQFEEQRQHCVEQAAHDLKQKMSRYQSEQQEIYSADMKQYEAKLDSQNLAALEQFKVDFHADHLRNMDAVTARSLEAKEEMLDAERTKLKHVHDKEALATLQHLKAALDHGAERTLRELAASLQLRAEKQQQHLEAESKFITDAAISKLKEDMHQQEQWNLKQTGEELQRIHEQELLRQRLDSEQKQERRISSFVEKRNEEHKIELGSLRASFQSEHEKQVTLLESEVNAARVQAEDHLRSREQTRSSETVQALKFKLRAGMQEDLRELQLQFEREQKLAIKATEHAIRGVIKIPNGGYRYEEHTQEQQAEANGVKSHIKSLVDMYEHLQRRHSAVSDRLADLACENRLLAKANEQHERDIGKLRSASKFEAVSKKLFLMNKDLLEKVTHLEGA